MNFMRGQVYHEPLFQSAFTTKPEMLLLARLFLGLQEYRINQYIGRYGYSFYLACLPRLTLKALFLIPLLLILFWFALNVVSLGGRTGSFTSRFSARESSSNNKSFEKAPSSISSIIFPLKSILLKVA